MIKKWLIAFFAPLCLLALGVPVLRAQKANTSTTIPGNTKLDKSAKPDKRIKADKAEKKPLQPPQDETAHPRPERQDEDRSMWSRAKQAIPSPFPALEKKAEKNAAIGEAKRGDRAARIDQLKDQLASKTHPDTKAAQAELDNLRKQRSIGEKLEASSLYKLGEKQKIKTDARTKTPEERKDRANEIAEELKNPISRQRKWELETEREALLKKPTLNERIASSSVFEKAQSLNASASNKITSHSTALQVGGAALIAGGVLAAGGALAVGIGGVAAAKKDVLNSLTPSTGTTEDTQGSAQSSEGMFIPSSFAPPAE